MKLVRKMFLTIYLLLVVPHLTSATLNNIHPTCFNSKNKSIFHKGRNDLNLSFLSLRGGSASIPVLKSSQTNDQSGYFANMKRKQSIEEKGSSVDKDKLFGVFPIKKYEIRQFVAMSIMMFLFIYVYTTVRDTKDTLVVSKCGAEAIPFLKMYGVMPAAFLFIIGYSKMSSVLSKQMLFYAVLIPFFVFYTLFAFVLFPNRDIIHFASSSLSESSEGVLRNIMTSATNLIRYWSYSLYFIVSELWASAGVPLLFWQVANDITSVSQAKRFYPLFAVLGNLAPIASGKVMSYIISKQKSIDDVGFGSTLKSLAFIKILSCVSIVALYNLIYAEAEKVKNREATEDLINRVKQVQKGELQITQIQFKTGKKKVENIIDNSIVKQKKPTLRESLAELSKSKELQSMAMMVLSYNVCIELTEVLWKGILRKSFPNNSDYMNYMASFSQKVGMIALVMQLSASFIISRLGWVWASRLTPLSMALLAIPFFISVSMATKNNSIPISLALAIGTWQNVVNKVTKYSIFDPLKEMAYIPLGEEAKIKGKAAIDVMGARLGRCVAAGSQQVLVLFGGSILNCSPQLSIIYVGIISVWIRAISVLGKKFDSYEQALNNDRTNEETAKFGNLTLKTRRK